MRAFNYVLEISLGSRHKWNHFRLHRHRTGPHWSFGHIYWRHLVWGPISVIFGQPHLVPVIVCKACGEEIRLVGEDYLSWCEGCQSVEGETEEITTEEYERRQS